MDQLVLVQLWNSHGAVVDHTDVRTKPHRTFDRLMRQVCRFMGCSLADYDVVAGDVLLNDCALEMRTFNIPAGRCLLVDMRPKRELVTVQLRTADGTVVDSTDVTTKPHRTFDRLMRQVCRFMGCSLADYDVVADGVLLNDCALEMRTFDIPAGGRLLVDMRPKWIDSSF